MYTESFSEYRKQIKKQKKISVPTAKPSAYLTLSLRRDVARSYADGQFFCTPTAFYTPTVAVGTVCPTPTAYLCRRPGLWADFGFSIRRRPRHLAVGVEYGRRHIDSFL